MIAKLLKKYCSTAGMVCAFRGALAHDRSYPMGDLFRDKFAAAMCGRPWSWAFICPPLSVSLLLLMYRKLVPSASVLVVRAYYMESQLESFAANHQNVQYVMVAAGLDSFLLRKRQLAEQLRVFEIDLPEPQQLKQARLKSMGCHIPAAYHFVTANLFSQNVMDELERHGFDVSSPTFFSLMGFIYYIPKSSFLKVVESIATRLGAGSVIVLDYLLDDDSLDVEQLRFKRHCSSEVTDVGEDFVYETSSEELEADMAAFGWQKVSMMPIQDLYASLGLTGHPTAGVNCFALAMFTLAPAAKSASSA